MGCDIHMSAEALDPATGKWALIDRPIVTCEDCKGTGKGTDHKGKASKCWMCAGKGKHSPSWYDGRCYDDFAILADVRNGRGFAGVITGSGFDPIDQPRGIPEDASDEYKNETANWGADGHSHSHQTLQELLDFDWAKTTQHIGVVDAVIYYDWWKNRGKKGSPETWFGGMTGEGITKVTNEGMEKLFEDGAIEAPKLPADREELQKFLYQISFSPQPVKYITNIVWELSYKESAVNLWHGTIPALVAYATEHKLAYDQIRIVYFFDN